MATVVRTTTADARDALAATAELPILDCLDGDAVVVLAGLRGDLPDAVGVRLVANEDYPAALIARDVATLSHLVGLTTVVVGGDDADDAVTLIQALLGDEPVTLANAAGTLTEAYNRPAPARPLTVVTDAALSA
jgi:hypothetical protein